ncbi:hypothetical protein NMG60_11029819 [Bertholletia excelsa]
MATEVLRPQDCLIDRIRVSPAAFQHQRRRNSGRKPAAARPEPKKRPEQAGRSGPARRSASVDNLRNNNHGHLVMGQVTILRRGESLDSKIAAAGNHSRHRPEGKKAATDDLALCGTGRLGPDPQIVPKQIRMAAIKSALLSPPATISSDRPDVYAGSAFSMSPSPSSLPLPSFFSKKQFSRVAVDGDSATRDLRRLLRLD